MAKKTTLKFWTNNGWEDLFPTTKASLVTLKEGATVEDAIFNSQAKLDTVEHIAKGAQKGVAFVDYAEMISDLKSSSKDKYILGQSIYIGTLTVPDVWIGEIREEYQEYTYTSEQDLADILKNQGRISVGYYTIYPLETGKVFFDHNNNITNGEGEYSLKQKGALNTAAGTFAFSIGDGCVADGNKSFAFGTGTHIYDGGNSSIGGGQLGSIKSACALLCGYSNEIQENAYCSAVFGAINRVNGQYSLVWGTNNILTGNASTIGGTDNTNSGAKAVVYGWKNINEGQSSAVFGEGNIHKGRSGVNFGSSNENTGGNANSVIGTHLKQDYYANGELIVGRYNLIQSGLMFSVGIGTSEETRKNGFTVHTDGRASVLTAPKDPTNVVRKKELDEAIANAGGKLYEHYIQLYNDIEGINASINFLSYRNTAITTFAELRAICNCSDDGLMAKFVTGDIRDNNNNHIASTHKMAIYSTGDRVLLYFSTIAAYSFTRIGISKVSETI